MDPLRMWEVQKKIEPVVVPDVEPDTNPVRDDENDFAISLKKAESDQSAGDSKPQQKEVVDADEQNHASVTMLWINSVKRLNQNGAGLSEGNVQNDCTSNVGTVNEQVSRSPTGGTEKVELIVDSDSESYTSSDSDPPEIMYYYPNTEFSDFDKHKTENCFAVDQIWAVYDTLDFMPRFYAHIRKVSGPEFKIKLRWLEPHPEEDQRVECAWIRADLPVGCGKFRVGNTYYTNDGLIFFSSSAVCDGSESSDPENHRNYKYEIVEILSDYVGDIGIQVGYLDKMTEFLSLFQRTKRTEVGIFFVRPKEIYKFSHQIPSFKMTGTEREGVPSGSFELDPASLPLISTGTSGKSDNAKTSLKSGDLEDNIHDESCMFIDLELKLWSDGTQK
uniref:Heat shock protein DnaJ n=1 Tax=Solanum tuberosum TaxID=4113 RepID=M1C1U8_SOLTU